MRKRLLGLIATGAIVVAACGPSAATTAPSTGTTPETARTILKNWFKEEINQIQE